MHIHIHTNFTLAHTDTHRHTHETNKRKHTHTHTHTNMHFASPQVARGFNKVYDLKLTVRGEMEAAYLGEILTPSKCGRMDQVSA